MSNKRLLPIENLIAKIDNDFNPDNSDWIPRVGAWAIDAMSQLKVLRKVTKKTKIEVHNRLARHKCCFVKDDFKVFDANGNEIKEADEINKDACGRLIDSSTGNEQQNEVYDDYGNPVGCNTNGARTLERNYNHPGKVPRVYSEHYNSPVENARHNVTSTYYSSPTNNTHNYVFVKGDTIELNFDTDYITIVNKEVETSYSDTYHCDLPMIPANGLLMEALAYYCMYKMLTRGYKHPVFNLAASQYGTNPYYMWQQLKDKAKTSVTLDEQDDISGDGWQSFFFNFTFPKR